MRRVKRPKIGEYVLLARWRDKSFYDPWEVGYLTAITERAHGIAYCITHRFYPNCWRISREEGESRIATYRKEVLMETDKKGETSD